MNSELRKKIQNEQKLKINQPKKKMKITYTKQSIKIDKKGKKRIIPQMMIKVAVNDDESTKDKSPNTISGGSKMEIEKDKTEKTNQ